MDSTIHEAVLVGPAARPLRSILPDLVEAVRLTEREDLYEAVRGLTERPPESLWIDATILGAEDLGALRLLRRLLPDCGIVLLLTAGEPAPELATAAAAIGCRTLRRPLQLRAVNMLLVGLRRPPRPAATSSELVAGLADQLNNPLAALAGRLQLLSFALDAGDRQDLADNLGLAIRSAERMQATLAKLSMLAGRKRPVLRRFSLLEAARSAAGPIAIIPGTEDVEVVGDDELTIIAIGGILRVLSDLAGNEPVPLAVVSAAGEATLEARLAAPVPMPCSAAEICDPFRLNRLLNDPDLGLDLAVSASLLYAQDGRITALAERGFLAGLACTLPR